MAGASVRMIMGRPLPTIAKALTYTSADTVNKLFDTKNNNNTFTVFIMGGDDSTVSSRHKEVKKKKRKRTRQASSSSSCSSTERRQKKAKKKEKKKSKKKAKKKKSKDDIIDTSQVERLKKSLVAEKPAAKSDSSSASGGNRRSMVPMTKAEWDEKQSVVRRVYDEDTGRTRLVKGDGEILEEIVSESRHKDINRTATRGDGLSFQASLSSQLLRR